MCKGIRKIIYEEFANEANRTGIQWYVLHGIEGYPGDIGRDLDIFVESEDDSLRLMRVFKDILKKHGFRWIITPNPIWGQRVFGIDSGLQSVELHTVNQVRSGILNFSKVKKPVKQYLADLFPYDRYLMFSKGCLMPLLAKDERAHSNYESLTIDRQDFPNIFSPLLGLLEKRGQIGVKILAYVYFKYTLEHPAKAIASFAQWVGVKFHQYFASSGPIIMIKNSDINQVRNQLKEKLSYVFSDIFIGDKLDVLKIRRLSSVQKAVLLTRKRCFIKPHMVIDFQDVSVANVKMSDEIIIRILDCMAGLYEPKRSTNKVVSWE